MGAGVSGDMKDTAEDHSTHPKREKGDIVSRTFFDLVILIYGLLQKTWFLIHQSPIKKAERRIFEAFYTPIYVIQNGST